MPHYYFHARDQSGLKKDDEGQDLPNLDAARVEALTAAEQLWCNLSADVAREAMSIEIADETGATVLTVPFTEAGKRLADGTAEPLEGNGISER